ncbi:hypothetical protein KBY55_09440 [Streptomyces sp. b94]|uniref:hypothetical protein n=1 Tax=Streptomyces sp. b94 TaxID=1827634 RepID=UPI001B39C784|nr:hypothetical protein [Streptomyces sp. b94]MBQ1096306.1 hypothetical protein [Streptomyces sp. b94]
MTAAQRTVRACQLGAFLAAACAGYSLTWHPWLAVPGLVGAGFLLWGAASARGAAARQEARHAGLVAAAASDEQLLRPAPRHVGGGANAEDCPACVASPTPPPYPFICPGPVPADRDQPSAH